MKDFLKTALMGASAAVLATGLAFAQDASQEGEMQMEGQAGAEQGESGAGADVQIEGEVGTETTVGTPMPVPVQLSAEHETAIRQHFTAQTINVAPADITDLSIEIGVHIPATVALHPLPGAIIADLPPGCDYAYFLWNDDIVVVCQETRVVALVVADVHG